MYKTDKWRWFLGALVVLTGLGFIGLLIPGALFIALECGGTGNSGKCTTGKMLLGFSLGLCFPLFFAFLVLLILRWRRGKQPWVQTQTYKAADEVSPYYFSPRTAVPQLGRGLLFANTVLVPGSPMDGSAPWYHHNSPNTPALSKASPLRGMMGAHQLHALQVHPYSQAPLWASAQQYLGRGQKPGGPRASSVFQMNSGPYAQSLAHIELADSYGLPDDLEAAAHQHAMKSNMEAAYERQLALQQRQVFAARGMVIHAQRKQFMAEEDAYRLMTRLLADEANFRTLMAEWENFSLSPPGGPIHRQAMNAEGLIRRLGEVTNRAKDAEGIAARLSDTTITAQEIEGRLLQLVRQMLGDEEQAPLQAPATSQQGAGGKQAGEMSRIQPGTARHGGHSSEASPGATFEPSFYSGVAPSERRTQSPSKMPKKGEKNPAKTRNTSPAKTSWNTGSKEGKSPKKGRPQTQADERGADPRTSSQGGKSPKKGRTPSPPKDQGASQALDSASGTVGTTAPTTSSAAPTTSSAALTTSSAALTTSTAPSGSGATRAASDDALTL